MNFRTTHTVWKTALPAVALMILLPIHGFAKDRDVVVVNDYQTPVPTEDVDHPARQPFQRSASFTNATDGPDFGASFPPVPAGKRLVIEFMSASCHSTDGVEPTSIRITSNVDHFFSLEKRGFGTGFSAIATHKTKFYAEPGSTLYVGVFPTTNAATITCNAAVSGHYVDI